MASIGENLERVRKQIAKAVAEAGRSADGIELVAITKTHPTEKVREAIEAGQILFGESRVQEARAKIPELPSNLRWHFVGHLQKNKIRHALQFLNFFMAWIHFRSRRSWTGLRTKMGCIRVFCWR